jgi:hypothetical protein
VGAQGVGARQAGRGMSGPVFVGVDMADLMTGRTAMVTGLEDEPDGALKVYVGPRWRGVYVLVDDAEAKDAIRRGWAVGGHLLIPIPAAKCLWRGEPAGSDQPSHHAGESERGGHARSDA